ncbi:MAG: hypothetical protein HC819_23480 [Cyclobacteriaceae bacterium]|nr:hypothetical protein [Cyclobacteriaceae bacterium]
MKTLPVFFILLGLSFSSCEDLLPDLTLKSTNFNCQVNGKNFNPKSSDFKGSPTYAYKKDNILVVKGNRTTSGFFEQVEIGINSFSGKKTYSLYGSAGKSAIEFDDNHGYYRISDRNSGSEITANTDNINRGKLVVTYHDPSNKKIAGTFEFTAISATTGKIYIITDGSFDLTYRNY